MKTKDQLRKKFLKLRKKNYFETSKGTFNQLSNYIIKKYKGKKKILIGLYYPSNYEINILKIYYNFKKLKARLLLPKIEGENILKFFKWDLKDITIVNKYGIPEPIDTKKKYIPDVIFVPLVAFDQNLNRLGYGKGFYDRYLNNLIKLNKKEVEAIGVAFSFQKCKKIPISKFDFKLNKIFTEKGFFI